MCSRNCWTTTTTASTSSGPTAPSADGEHTGEDIVGLYGILDRRLLLLARPRATVPLASADVPAETAIHQTHTVGASYDWALPRHVHPSGWDTHRLIEAGDPYGPTVVLVHDGAFGTDSLLCWEGVIPALADRYHVVAPDLIGWVGTDKLCYFDRSPYDYRLEHLAAVCRVLAVDDPVLYAGSSFGSELVARGVAEPRWGCNARAAVAITGTGGRLYRVPGGIERLSDYTPSLEAARRLTAMLVHSTDGLDDHIRRRFTNSMAPGHWEALSALGLRNPSAERVVRPEHWPEPLLQCDVPVLFVEGSDDPLLEQGWAAKMAGLGDSFSSVVVPGGHEPNIEHPEDTGRLIRDFFDSCA